MLAHLPSGLHFACLLSRPVLSNELCEWARDLARAGLDWDCFLNFVLQQTVFPLVSVHASQALSDVIPPQVRRKLRACALVSSKRSEAMASELVAILTLLGRAGIRAVPLKGPVLIERIWGDSRLSVCQDLDLLVRPDEARRATEILVQRGYRPNDEYLRDFPPWKLASHSLSLLRFHELSFPICLDLETTFEYEWFQHTIPADCFWERLERSHFRGVAVWLLPGDWNLVLVGLHALRHLFLRLHWVADVHGLARLCPRPWPKALRLAENMGVREELLLARKVCDVILGEDVVEPEATDPLVRHLAESPFWPPPSRLAEHRLQLAIRRRTRAKIAYLLSGLFRPGPADTALRALPSRLRLAYYIIRPVRLLAKYFIALPVSAAWKFASERFQRAGSFDSKVDS